VGFGHVDAGELDACELDGGRLVDRLHLRLRRRILW
jgi:hypothetical protein